MTDEREAVTGGITLLERAVGYTLGSLHLVTPADLPRPTPCRGWDLRALLDHMDDSLLALTEAVDDGQVGLATMPARLDLDGVDPVAVLRTRACHLLGAWTGTQAQHGPVRLGVRELTTGLILGTGAIEVAVHGWDVAMACGSPRPIPDSLAEELLDLSPLFVTDADRPWRFARPVPVPALAGPADRLLGYLGRDPG